MKVRNPTTAGSWGDATVKALAQEAAATAASQAPAVVLPTPPPATMAAPGSIDAAIRALVAASQPSLDADAVRALVAEEMAKRETTSLAITCLPASAAPATVTVEGQHPQFAALVEELGLGHHVYLGGPAGSGKTTAVRKAAEVMGRPFFLVTAVMDTFEIKGYNNVQGDFVETEASRWAEMKGALLLLDEVDGCSPQATLGLNSAFADRILATAKGKLHIDPSNLVVATANTWGGGATNDYVGRNKLDAAFLDRFQARLAWDYDERFERRIAMAQTGCTDAAMPGCIQAIRANARKAQIKVLITPRATFAYCRRRMAGISHLDALNRGVLAGLDETQRNKLLDGVVEP